MVKKVLSFEQERCSLIWNKTVWDGVPQGFIRLLAKIKIASSIQVFV